MQGPWKHYVDWFIYPPIAVAIAALTARSAAWCGFAIAGFVFWTFVEYWTHRSILHRFLWHGTHQHHHLHPKAFVVFPLYYLPTIFAVIFVAMALVLPAPQLWPIYAGFLVGYTWFMTMHHWLHHIELTGRPRWLQRYAIWHNRHHKLDNINFGITTPMWDVLFGTSR